MKLFDASVFLSIWFSCRSDIDWNRSLSLADPLFSACLFGIAVFVVGNVISSFVGLGVNRGVVWLSGLVRFKRHERVQPWARHQTPGYYRANIPVLTLKPLFIRAPNVTFFNLVILWFVSFEIVLLYDNVKNCHIRYILWHCVVSSHIFI